MRSSNVKRVRPLRERLREATADEILTAAEECIADSGAQKAAMGQIARRAGLAVGTLYNHFQDKDALLAALLKRRRHALLAKIDESMADHAKERFEVQLTETFTVMFDFFDAHRSFMSIVRDDASKESTLRAIFERFEELVRRGIKKKALRADAEELAAAMIFGVVRGLFARQLWTEQRASLRAQVDTLIDLLLHGIARRP